MKNYPFVLFLIMIISISCYAGKKTTKKKKQASSPAITYVSMNRSACFGRCPVYAIEVYSNGLVRYDGYMFTQHQGVYEKNYGAANTQSLLKRFSTYRPDTCSEEYHVLISDIPGVNYRITYNGNDKIIMNANFGPEFLKSFARSVDSAYQVDKTWTKVADTALTK